MKLLKKLVGEEVRIEYKATLYFFCILFFYCVYQITQGRFQASILHMAEMIFATYIMCYIQVYLLRNFDEPEKITLFEVVALSFCSLIYAACSYFLSWFDKKLIISVIFFAYMVVAYFCMFLANYMKRQVDTEILNKELEAFKNKQ